MHESFYFTVISYLQPEIIQDFLPRLLPCSSKLYYKGLYGHISDLEHFFLDLIFTPKPNFLDCIRYLSNFESKNSGWNKANLHFSNSPRGVVLFSSHGR